MGKKLYVGNLSYDMTSSALEALFANLLVVLDSDGGLDSRRACHSQGPSDYPDADGRMCFTKPHVQWPPLSR